MIGIEVLEKLSCEHYYSCVGKGPDFMTHPISRKNLLLKAFIFTTQLSKYKGLSSKYKGNLITQSVKKVKVSASTL